MENLDFTYRFANFVMTSESAFMVWVEVGAREIINQTYEDMGSMERKGFYHVCTDGNVLPWMFKDDQDFIAGINRIAICKAISGVSVWAFTLMDNHVHLLLYGTLPMCKLFIDKYKLLTGKWISHKYNLSKHIKGLPTSVIPLKAEEDILETIAYIDRNSLVAGFKGLPSDYLWSSSCMLFKDRGCCVSRSLKEFSDNELRGLLKTRVTLPTAWTINEQGMLDPECFTEWKKVEALFKSPVRYLYYLTKRLEGKIDLTLSQSQKTFIRDKDLRVITIEICKQNFATDEIRKLDIKSRLTIARSLRRDYASTTKQIARMLYLNADVLKGFV